MVARPIVHIGYHKTATTWFQRRFWPSVASHRYVPREIAQAALLDPPGMMLDVARAREMIYDSDDSRPPVLCEENFSGYIHNNGLHGLIGPKVASRIARVMPDARIMVFLRSQPEMIRASYAQYIYAGGTHSVERYLYPSRKGALAQPYKAPHFAFSHFRYLELLRVYRDLFGSANVHVFLYEAFRDDQESFLVDMCQRLGVTPGSAGAANMLPRENSSWDARAIGVARTLNGFTRRSVVDKSCLVHVPGMYSARKALCNSITGLPGSRRFELPEHLLQPLAVRFAHSNRELANEFALPLARYGYPLPTLALVEGGLADPSLVAHTALRQTA